MTSSQKLKALFQRSHQSGQPKDDQSKDSNLKRVRQSERIKRLLGFYIYPIKNRMEKQALIRKLKKIKGFESVAYIPDIISVGHKGFAQEIFLFRIRKAIKRKISVVICYGCGMGDEVENVARILRPDKIIGIDYFNYSKYWDAVKNNVSRGYNVKVEFYQLDYQRPDERLFGIADMIYSHAVLEHLIDMEDIYNLLKKFLRPGGYFSAQWGPMWNSYSGDHISGELGLKSGFKHLQLPVEEYINYYKSHPRNVQSVEKGEPTWLELGLHNFSLYNEYIESLVAHFGNIALMHWVLSSEAFDFKKAYPEEWDLILKNNPELNELDLVLQCAGILLSPNFSNNKKL